MAPPGHLASLALLVSSAFAVADAIRVLKGGPMVDAEGREFKTAPLRPDGETPKRPQSNDGSSVQVFCTEATMVVVVNADLFKTGHLVSPRDLFLGEAHSKSSQCRAVVLNDSEYVLEAGLQDCGSNLSISGDFVIYSNELIVSPAATFHGITRLTHAVVPVSCHYKRTHLVSSTWLHEQPPAALSLAGQHQSKGHTSFSLKLMKDDWSGEMSNNVFLLGDLLRLEASYTGPDAGRRRLFIDNCVVTLTDDVKSVPRYDLIENHGCFTDGKASGSHAAFQPRKRPDALQLQFDAFLFHQDPRNSVFITCQLRATTEMWKSSPGNKACNYVQSSWKNVDGSVGVCQCCENVCHTPPAKEMTVCGSVTLGPVMIFRNK